MPRCLKERIVLVDLDREDWFDRAMEEAVRITGTPYLPSWEALGVFDQNRSFREMQALLFA